MENNTPLPNPRFVAIDEDGKPGDLSVLEEQNIAFDPTQQTLDLTKAEKRRMTALMLAIQAYDKLIIKDAEMYNAIARENARQHDGPVIQPATMNAMVEAAMQFDAFIAGKFEEVAEEPTPE
jgi:hypothetical protein